MSIEEAFLRVMEENKTFYKRGYAPNNTTKIARYVVASEPWTFDATCFFLEAEEVLLTVIALDLQVDFSKETVYQEVMESVNKFNHNATLGVAYFDPMLKNVFIKLSQFVQGTPEEMTQQVARCLMIAGVNACGAMEILD